MTMDWSRTLTVDQRALREAAAEFARRELAPRATDVDRLARIEPEIRKRLATAGFFGLPFPEAVGGSDGDTVAYALMIEEFAKVCGSTALFVAQQIGLVGVPLLRFGTTEQQQHFLTPLLNGEKLGAFGLTEPSGGSDAGAPRTTARPDARGWIIKGSKVFITSGSLADFVIVTARTDGTTRGQGISCFIVERGMPGFSVLRDDPKFGVRGTTTSHLVFDSCLVPAENLLGERGAGYQQFLEVLDGGRIAIAAIALGLGEAAYAAARSYANERESFDTSLVHHQAIATKLADMATQLMAARLLTYQAARAKDLAEPYRLIAAQAKLFASEAAERICHDAMQIFGGSGYLTDNPVERYYRDCRLTEIGEGTSEILRLVINHEEQLRLGFAESERPLRTATAGSPPAVPARRKSRPYRAAHAVSSASA
jgi:butyryl-CoA dehydrogenase